MSHWNYRVVRRKTEEGDWYAIHEAYYDDQEKVTNITENPVGVAGESMLELKQTLQRMLADADKRPVLDYETLAPAGG